MRYIIRKNEQDFPIHYMKVDEYVVDTRRPFEGYEPDDLICNITLFDNFRLEIAIRKTGLLIFRSWTIDKDGNSYLHTYEKPGDFIPTKEQVDTVAGLFSGRITYEGLKLAVGGTLQKICSIDIEKEEERMGKTIYLA